MKHRGLGPLDFHIGLYMQSLNVILCQTLAISLPISHNKPFLITPERGGKDKKWQIEVQINLIKNIVLLHLQFKVTAFMSGDLVTKLASIVIEGSRTMEQGPDSIENI